jgi:DNA-binding winged helix-turn-helix (wHTH) protein
MAVRFRLEPEARMLYEGERRLRLGSRALEILLTLIERAESVVSKEELLARVWPGLHVDVAALRVHISALRKALGDDPAAPSYVLNVAGRGYCFVAPITRAAAEDSPSDDLSVTMPRPAVHPIGREATICGLITSLRQHGFVTITGPGGIGKTTVALGVAASLAGGYSAGQTFVDLAALVDPRLLPSALASAFRLRSSSDDPTADLIAWVRNRQMLLVLDNCEHLVDAAAVLGEQIRAAAPEVHLLTTSREPLRAAGEWVTRLPPLGLPPSSKGAGVKDALESPAVQLFVERARAADDRFALDDDNTASVIDICHRLDGIPWRSSSRPRGSVPSARRNSWHGWTIASPCCRPVEEPLSRATEPCGQRWTGATSSCRRRSESCFAGSRLFAAALRSPPCRRWRARVAKTRRPCWTASPISSPSRSSTPVRRAARRSTECSRRYAPTRLRDWRRAGKARRWRDASLNT